MILFKPAAAVGHPPAEDQQRDGQGQAPVNGQGEVRKQPKRDEQKPEDLALHKYAFDSKFYLLGKLLQTATK